MAEEPREEAVIPPERLWRLPTWLLAHLGTDANRSIVESLGSPGERSDYAVLAGLDQYGSTSQADLGRRLGIYRSDLVAILKALDETGLIDRKPDRNDPRRNTVTITAAGRRALKRLDAKVEAAQEAVLAPLSGPERTELVGLLQRLVEHHRNYRHEPDAP